MSLSWEAHSLANECKTLRERIANGEDVDLKRVSALVKVGELELKAIRAQMEIANKQDLVLAITRAREVAGKVLALDGLSYEDTH